MNSNKTLPPPQLFSKSTLNPIRVVELKYLLNYGETLTQVRWTNRNARKQQLVDMLTDQFKLLFEKRDRANYELLLGCASQYSKTIATQEYYSWHNSLAYPYSKTNGAWLQFDVANRPAPWTLGSSPGCLVEQSSMASLVGGRAGSKSQPSAVSFDRLEFASSDLVTPVEPVHQAVVYMETRGVMHSKQMSFKLSADVVELLEDDPQRNDGARHGVFWFMCDYEDASAYLRQTPKRPVSVRYPSIMSMVVNSRAIQLPNMAQMRPDTPIELASHLVKSSVVNNVVHVNYRTDGRYVGMLMVAKVHTKQSIIAEIRNTSYVDAAKVRNEFFGSSSTDADDDLVSTGALVSLKCPLGLSRVTIPSRSRFCAHSQCFDCDTFLQMHMNIATWKCPVCSMVIKSWRELIIDGYFDSILKGTSEDDEQVYVEADGTWKAKDSLAAKGGAQLHKKRRLSDEDSADNDAIDLSDSSSLGSPRQSRAIKRARNDDVVDLTLDSDSDSGKEPDADDMLNAITQDDIEFIEAMMTSSENNAGTTRTANVRTTTRIAQSQPMVTVTPVRGLHGPRYDSASASRSDVEKFQAITDAFSDYIRQAIPKPISPMRSPPTTATATPPPLATPSPTVSSTSYRRARSSNSPSSTYQYRIPLRGSSRTATRPTRVLDATSANSNGASSRQSTGSNTSRAPVGSLPRDFSRTMITFDFPEPLSRSTPPAPIAHSQPSLSGSSGVSTPIAFRMSTLPTSAPITPNRSNSESSNGGVVFTHWSLPPVNIPGLNRVRRGSGNNRVAISPGGQTTMVGMSPTYSALFVNGRDSNNPSGTTTTTTTMVTATATATATAAAAAAGANIGGGSNTSTSTEGHHWS